MMWRRELTFKWEAKHRWWRRIVMGDFEQIDIMNGERLYTSRNISFTPVRIKELISLLLFAERSEELLVKEQRKRVENGVEMSCLQAERENGRGKADHLYFCDRQMSVLSITLLHAAVLRTFFGVFFHVVHRGIGDDTSRSHRMTHVLGESDFTAARLPKRTRFPRNRDARGFSL